MKFCLKKGCASRVWISGALVLMVSSTTVLAASPQLSVEDRLQRIERIIENPVLLQLSRRLGEQQREIQELQDQIDYLQRDLRNAKHSEEKRYKENDERLSLLEKNNKKMKAKMGGEESLLVPALQLETTQSGTTGGGDISSNLAKGDKTPVNPLEDKVVLSEAGLENDVSNVHQKVITPIQTRPATEAETIAYQQAFDLIKDAQYDASIKAFQHFVKNSPQSKLASNAFYWMGEAYYIKQDNQKALDAFNGVIKTYPNALKMADAMLRAADCLDNLDQTDEAKKIYTDLSLRYPQSLAAEKAIKRLENL